MGDFALAGKYADAFKKPVGFDPAVFGGASPQIGIAPGSSSQPTTPKTLEEALAGMLAQRTPEAEAKARREQLQDLLAFQGEQMKKAAPYKLMFDLPGQITQAFALPGTIAMEGANRVANTVMEGVRALPAPQVVARSAQYTPMSYFGRG